MAKKRKPPPPPIVPPDPPAPVLPEDVPLTVDELRFVDEWMVDRREGPAYQRAFPLCISMRAAIRHGRAFRQRPNVSAEIQARLRAQAIRCQVSSDQVIHEIKRVAFSDVLDLFDPLTNQLRHPRHIPYDARKAISSIRTTRTRKSKSRGRKYTTTTTDQFIEYRLWNKMEALGKLCKHLGLDTEASPLETLLAALPRHLAMQVRMVLANETVVNPSSNGTH